MVGKHVAGKHGVRTHVVGRHSSVGSRVGNGARLLVALLTMAASLALVPGTAVAQTPTISNVTFTPVAPGAADDVVVVATVVNPTAPILTYKVAFGAEVGVPMADDGLLADVTAADGMYTASIPAQAAGELVRYKVADGGVSVPAAADSFNYLGYVVADPTVSTTLADFRWFIDPVDFDAMYATRLQEDPEDKFPAVLAYDGEVYDNVMVGIGGNNFAQANYPKQSFDFTMPAGHLFTAPDLPYAVDEFELKGSWVDFVHGRNQSSLDVFEQAGFPTVNTFPVHLERNGAYYGMFVFSEKLDETWLDASGLTGGEFYESSFGGFLYNGTWDVERPAAGSTATIDALSSAVRSPAGNTKTQFLYDTFDIPQVINYMAISALIGHNDQQTDNYFMYNDSDRTGRWQMYSWDLEVSFGVDLGGCDEQDIPDLRCVGNPLFDSIYEVAELEEMYWRRVRSLLDGPFAGTALEDAHAARIAALGSEPTADEALWDRFDASLFVGVFQQQIADRRSVFTSEARVPTAHAANSTVVITEILARATALQAEFIELYNPNGYAVDVSGWTIDGIGSTLPQGAVIPAGGYLIGTSDISSFDGFASPYKTTVFEFPGDLANGGEALVLKNASGTVIDQVTYDNVAPWPAPAGGFSYELNNPILNNNNGANWSSSAAAGGTPGPARNVPDAPSNVMAVALDSNQSTVSWTSPDDGGSDVTSTTVTATPGGNSCTAPGTDTSCVVTGLAGGTRHTFTVVATNAVGAGPASDGVTVLVGPLPVTLDASHPCFGLIPTHVGTNLDDSIYATQDDDIILTYGGNDTVWGRDGSDIICVGSGNDRVFAGSGDNLVYGGAGIDKMRAGVGNDTIYGGDDRDFLKGGHGDDKVYGEGGTDRIRGSVGDDVIRGGDDNDVLWGGPGNDTMFGEGGNDILKGSAGDDTLRGNDGNDTLKGSDGNDTCNGGPGTDTADASCEGKSFIP